MKKIFSLFVAALMAVGAMAQNVETADFTAQGYENGQAIESYVGESFSIAFDKGTNKNNAPKYYNTGTAIRCYGANTMTFTSSNAENFTSIVFTFSSGEGTNEITANVGEFENNTWTGAADEVVFTIGGTSGHRRIQAVEVTIEEGTIIPIPIEEETRTLYLVPGEEWTIENARYAVYYWNTEEDYDWSEFMTLTENETSVYTTEIPADYTNVIFVVFNQSAEEPDWQGMTAQTVDLTVSEENNMFTIGTTSEELNGKYEGTWSTYVYVAPCVANYGIKVNGKFVPGSVNTTDAQWEVKNVFLTASDIVNVYSLCTEVTLETSVEKGADLFEIDGADLMVIEDGMYDFYIKLDYGNDKLYVEKKVFTCAEANTAQDGTELILGAFDVVYTTANGNIYIKDESGMTQIFKKEYGLKVGDHVKAGLRGKVTIYNNLTPELIPSTAFADLQVTAGDAPEVDDAENAPAAQDVNYIMMYRGVALAATTTAKNYTGIFNGREFAVFDKDGMIESLDENITYTIKGLVGYYKTNLQLTILDITADEGSCVQTYGLMVGNDYVRGRINEASGQWEMKNVKLNANDVVKLYDYCNSTSFETKNFENGSDYFEIEGAELTVKEEGVYSFYLTLDYGNDFLNVVKEEVVEPDYNTSADVNSAENGAELTLGEFVVVYVNRTTSGQYIYIKDANGMTLIYFKGENDYGLKAGDRVAAGLAGAVSIYKNLPEFIPATAFADLTVENGEVPAIADATGAPDMEDINKMFIYRGVTLGTEDNRSIPGKFNGQDITFYDRFDLIDLTAAESVISRNMDEVTYTITGCVSVYNETLQVYIAAIEEETGDSTGIDIINTDAASESKMMINGQLYILRDGKLYNAQGAVVR